jgi:hypothetical protein
MWQYPLSFVSPSEYGNGCGIVYLQLGIVNLILVNNSYFLTAKCVGSYTLNGYRDSLNSSIIRYYFQRYFSELNS